MHVRASENKEGTGLLCTPVFINIFYVYIDTCLCIYIYIHTHVYVYNVYMYIHTYIHIHIYVHTYIHIQIYKIHKYQGCVSSSFSSKNCIALTPPLRDRSFFNPSGLLFLPIVYIHIYAYMYFYVYTCIYLCTCIYVHKEISICI
jgi:hypothetical protein